MKLILKNVLFWLFLHIIAFKNITQINKSTKILNLILYILFGFGITGGYHRLYTHSSYTAPAFIRYIILIFGTGAFELSVISWSSLHRMHHKYESTNKELDPYSIQKYCDKTCSTVCRKNHMIKNFIHAHCAWMFYNVSPEFKSEQENIINEMKNNEWKEDLTVLNFQHKYYALLMPIITFIIPIFISKYVFKDSWKSSIGGTALRIIIVWHSTYFINSLAHVIGNRSNNTLTAANNHLCAFLALGEGYHNYHHTYPKDYYASKNIKCINLTGWILYVMAKLNLIHNTKRAISERRYEYKL